MERRFLALAEGAGLARYIYRAAVGDWLLFRMGEPTPMDLAERFADLLELFRARG